MDHESNTEFHTVRGYELMKSNQDSLTPAMEDYLEMVYRLCMQNHYTRIGRVSESLHVRPSSASKMVVKLAEKGFVECDKYEIILLTEKGRSTGAYLLHRHETVEHFLHLIGKKELLAEAELIEHVISDETVALINTLLAFFEKNSESKSQLQAFQQSANPTTQE